VLALDSAQVGRIQSALAQAGISVSAIAAPTGKIGVRDDFGPHLEAFKRGLELANRFGARYVRVFSFFIPEGDDPAAYRGEVLERMGALVKTAEGRGITLVHENERHIYGDTPERCLDLLSAIGSPILRAVWDPANFVQVMGPGARPHDQGYALLRPYIAYVHVKDAVAASSQVVPAGAGDGQLRETIAALQADGFDGFFSLEPHLASAGTYSGFSGPDLFRTAVQAFKELLSEQQIQWA
jgi:sugar phosphate isomerase/epimerase